MSKICYIFIKSNYMKRNRYWIHGSYNLLNLSNLFGLCESIKIKKGWCLGLYLCSNKNKMRIKKMRDSFYLWILLNVLLYANKFVQNDLGVRSRVRSTLFYNHIWLIFFQNHRYDSLKKKESQIWLFFCYILCCYTTINVYF